jgi:hypothetical protein
VGRIKQEFKEVGTLLDTDAQQVAYLEEMR